MSKRTTAGAAIPPELEKWITEFEKETGLNRSEIVRRALVLYRDSPSPDVERLRVKVRRLEEAANRQRAIEIMKGRQVARAGP